MAVYRQGTDLYFCQMGDSIVVFHEKDQEYFELNETAAFMWGLLKEPQSIRDVITQVRDHFDVDESVCEAQVTEFLENLASKRLVLCVD